MLMDGILLVRPGHTWFSTYLILTAVLVCNLMILLRMLCFILLCHTLWFGLEHFPRNVRVCGCLTEDDLKDSSSWSSTPLVLLRDIHNDILAQYDCKDCVSPPTLPGTRRTCSVRVSQDGVSQQEETGTLFLPELNNLVYQTNLRGEDVSNAGPTIPSQHRLTHQILI